MTAQRHEQIIADILLHESWRHVVPTPTLPRITVIESSEQLARRLARANADEYERPAIQRILGSGTRPALPSEHTARADWRRWADRMEACDAWERVQRPDRTERAWDALWWVIVVLLGLFAGLTALAALPRIGGA